MFDPSAFKAFMKKKKQPYPHCIWIKLPDAAGYQIVDRCEAETIQPPLAIPLFDKWHHEAYLENNRTLIWFKYPGDYYILVLFSQYILLEESDLSVIYHILYPCYSDQVIEAMERQLHMLAKRNEIHTRLADFSMQNMGMEKITLELQYLLGQPLIFVNLATGEHFPGNKRLPVNLGANELAVMFASQKSPQYLDPKKTGQATHYIYPIISGNICLGCFVLAIRQTLSQLDHMIIEQGGTIAALELVKNQSLTELYYRKAYQIFDELIHTNDPSALINKCNELSIDFNASYICIVFAFASNIDLQALEICVLRLISRIKKELSDVYQTVFFFENRVTLLASLKSADYMPDMISRIEGIIAHTQQSESLPLSAGMGSLYGGAGNISKSYSEASKALLYQITQHHPGLIKYSEIGINRLFINLSREDADTYLKEVFGPLKSISKKQNSNLEDTLVTYIDTNCSISQTAESLFIHINTLYQRLNKIEECLNISFSNSEDLLRIKLACYLKRSYAMY